MYIGSWKIDDLVTFVCNTHSTTYGIATDADSVPTYRVYEDETGTPILTGSMALLDSANTVGFYSEQITLSAANGFEKGKSYSIYISATVEGNIGTTSRILQVEAEVDANVVSDKTGYALTAAYDLAKTASQDSDMVVSLAKTNQLSFDSDLYILSHPSTPLTITTNNDKTGYALTSSYDPAKTASQDSDMAIVLSKTNQLTFDSDSYVLSHPSTPITVTTNNDKSGYSLTSSYDPAKTASQDSDMAVVLANVTPLTFDSDNYVLSHPMTTAPVTLDSDLIDEINATYSKAIQMTFDSDSYIISDARKISASATAADNVEANIPYLDMLISDIPTATENADGLLKRDWTSVTGEASRSVLNALRFIRNKFSTTVTPGSVTIYKEDDSTPAYTKTVTTDSDAEPIVEG